MSSLGRYDAILFDLLSALLDSWTLWNDVAGDRDAGLRWRRAYLDVTYGVGAYRRYEDLLVESAERAGLPRRLADDLVERWDDVQPWPEAPDVLTELARSYPVAVVTNCSEALGIRAARRVDVPFSVVVTAERSGFYKPDRRAYEAAQEALGVPPDRILFVAGSPYDVGGAKAAGMPVLWHNRLGFDDATAKAGATFECDRLDALGPLTAGATAD